MGEVKVVFGMLVCPPGRPEKDKVDKTCPKTLICLTGTVVSMAGRTDEG